jgi:hypothetical protein
MINDSQSSDLLDSQDVGAVQCRGMDPEIFFANLIEQAIGDVRGKDII